MKWLLFFPFLLQPILIFLDEVIFHRNRFVPKFERIGHPLDTLTVVGCFLFALLVPYSLKALYLFIGMALFSCFFVTKDEFIHKKYCPAEEMWLHACLFINHPILLGSLIYLWMGTTPLIPKLTQGFILSQLLLSGLFLSYQIIYWNFMRGDQIEDNTDQ